MRRRQYYEGKESDRRQLEGRRIELESAYLILNKDGSSTIEELEWSNDLALNQNRRDDGSRGPPSCTDWHLIKPLL